MASKTLATPLLCGILCAFAFFCVFQGIPAAQGLPAYPEDELQLLHNVTTISLPPREDLHAEHTVHYLSKRDEHSGPPQSVAQGAAKAEAKLLCYLNADTADRSTFSEDDPLDKWYSQGKYDNEEGTSITGAWIPAVMSSLKLPTKLGDKGLTEFKWIQDKPFEWNVGDSTVSYPGTEGYYEGCMSIPKGFISAEDNASPQQDKHDPVPELFRLSDVYFLEWQRQAANSRKIRGLKYFLRFHIINKDTRRIIKEATGHNVKTWPGDMFGIETDEAKALLATPNGIGVAYFLINHKPELGVKTVEKVQVWRNDDDPKWFNMLFYISQPRK
ncbi:uncharacterized protein APUU_50423S [Aspergillus puulaauensis]|uniref:Uncharacterized protein n=1 Tax=Aspergillus puulaauensis TaxID=1220207 RepID=A0A7R7XQV4_9EURO|nr:uncharacterized protein APUU_50423S [Aspergillus puulaauensis]BCS25712.1 hypothetical protein APUU_50423S [Aspergillus puulaauensis]